MANLLSVKNGVTAQHVSSYIGVVTEKLSENNGVNHVCVSFSDREVDDALRKHGDEFRRFRGVYFINKKLVLKHFNDRFDQDIAATLQEAAGIVLKER